MPTSTRSCTPCCAPAPEMGDYGPARDRSSQALSAALIGSLTRPQYDRHGTAAHQISFQPRM